MSINAKSTKKLPVLFGLCLLLAAVANCFAQETSFQIIPGVKAGAITARTTEADLRRIYGSRNVQSGEIGIGEGETVPGAIIFPNDPLRRLEIAWKDAKLKKNPDFVQFWGAKSLWKITHGISLGTRLKTLEQINGGSFKLYGFAWDYSGTVSAWNRGKLARSFGRDSRLVTLRLDPSYFNKRLEKDYEAVIGDGEFSSQHKSMQKLNPEVYMIIVNFR